MRTERATRSEKPNILFIMADDHAAQAISAYGSYRNRTPNIDRIAAGGMRLDNCFCTNSICTPSRASILTGTYSHVNGAITFNAPDASRATFPQLLRNQGYFTAIVGKWHLNCEPTGFARWSVLPGQGRYIDPDFVVDGALRSTPGYVTDLITDMTIRVLQERPRDRPFCVLCTHKAPHDPWTSDDAHEALFAGETLAEPDNLFDTFGGRAGCVRESAQVIGSANPGHTLYAAETASLGDPVQRRRAQYQIFLKRYLRCVASIDDNVGRLLRYLDEEELSETTIVVYTSDQGFFLGEHGFYDKRFMYEESLRMPFLARFPVEIAPATSDAHIVLNVDFAATFLDYAGIDPPAGMQGRSIRPLLSGRPPDDWRTSMYYRYYPSHFTTPSHWGVRTERYKYIYYHASDEHELYDLSDDPREMRNHWGEAAYREIASGLEAELATLRAQLGDAVSGSEGDRAAALLLAQKPHPLYG